MIEYGQFIEYLGSMLKESPFVRSFKPQVDFLKIEEITVFQYTETND